VVMGPGVRRDDEGKSRPASAHEMIDSVEADQSRNDQIERDNIVQQSWRDQDQQASQK
jgi:hypothetical protein